MTRLTMPKVPLVLLAGPAQAADKLVLDLDMDRDLISLAHNIDNFLFKPTMNFSHNIAGNLRSRPSRSSSVARMSLRGRTAAFPRTGT